MSTVIGALRYDIVADTSQFTRGMSLSRQEIAASRKVMAATTSDTELYDRRLASLQRMLRAGAIDQRAYNRAVDDLDRPAQQASAAIGRLDSMMRVAGGALLAAGIMQVKHALTSSVRANEEFQQAMATSLAIAGNVSVEMREKLTTASQQIAFNTKFSSTEAAGAIEFLQLAGLSLEQSLATMPQVAKFAQAGMFDLALATDLATDSQAAMGLNSADTLKHMQGMANVTDVLTKASTIANASIEQFAIAITNGAGPAARLVGMDIEETAAVLAAFASTGFAKAEEAGTQFGIVMRDLQTKAIQNKEAFRAAGIQVFDTSGDFQKMSSIIGNLETLLGGMSDEQAKLTLLNLGFSDKSVKSIQALLGQSEAIAQYEAKLREAGGTTDEVASKQLPPLTAALQQLAATWQVFTELSVNPVVEGLAETNGQVSAFSQFLAGVLDAVDMIRQGWWFISQGIGLAGTAVKGVAGLMLDMILQPLELMENMIGLLDSMGIAPEFATDLAEQSKQMRESISDSFSIEKDMEAFKQASAEYNKQWEGPSSGERFLARMAEVSKPLATVPQGGQQLPEPTANQTEKMIAEVIEPLKSVVLSQEEVARNFALAAMTQDQLVDEFMDGRISEEQYQQLARDAKTRERVTEPEKNEKAVSLASAAKGSAEAYRIVTEFMRAKEASGKEDKIVEATEKGNAELVTLNVTMAELNERIGVVG